MNIREELHRLLDSMLDAGEKIGYISYKENMDSPITSYRLQLERFLQWSKND